MADDLKAYVCLGCLREHCICHRIARLQKAADLEELMHETLRDALKRQREHFQSRWGSFLKCSGCGAWLCDGDYDVYRCRFCGGQPYLTGYKPPPGEDR